MPPFVTPLLVSLATLALSALGRLLLRTMRSLIAELKTTRTEIAKLPEHTIQLAAHTQRLDGIDVQIIRLTDDVADLKAGYESLRGQLVALLLPQPADIPSRESTNAPS